MTRINEMLEEIASLHIEAMTDVDEVLAAWQTADDITNRLHEVLVSLRYWWESQQQSHQL